MGILTGTRINFWGGIETNVCVANNTNSPGGEDILDLVNATIIGTKTDEELISWMRRQRSASGKVGYTEGGWNYYGDHLVNYKNATVSSEGPVGNMTTEGSLAGESVFLLGSIDPNTGQGPFFGPVMVDLDPTSSQTTQIFVGGLLIGSMQEPKLLIRHDTVCSSHSLDLRIIQPESDSPASSVGNGTFQVTFPKESIVKYDTSCETLNSIINDPDATGLVLRFSMFEMAPYMTTPELLADYAANINSSNPSSGRVIGSIGSAYDAEPATCPPGRILTNQVSNTTGYAVLGEDYLSIDTVSLMLKEKFREDRKDFTGPIGANIQYESLSLIVDDKKNTVSFNPLSTTYYLYGGIIDVPVTPEQRKYLAENPLQISSEETTATHEVNISEQPLRIYSNDRNIYLDEIIDTPERSCIVSYLGGPILEDMNFCLNSVSSGSLQNPRFLTYTRCISAKAGDNTITFQVEDNGGLTAGYEQLVITTINASYFINFRKYPLNNYDDIPAGSIVTWDQVYQHVLRFYYVVFPAMSKRITLNFEGSIKATGDQILSRTSDEYRNTTLYMPIVRSMTPSQIKLLRAYLNNTPWNP